MLVSAILPIKNYTGSLVTTLDSFARYKQPGIEIIVVHDGSDARLNDALVPYRDIIDVMIVEADRSIYEAWNKAIQVAKGHFMSFFGAGDVVLENTWPTLFEHLDDHIDFIVAKSYFYEGDQVLRIIGANPDISKLKTRMPLVFSCALVNRKIFQQHGNFDASYQIAGDYEMLLRVADDFNFLYIDKVLHRIESGGISQRLILKTLTETMRAKIAHRVKSRGWCYVDWIWALLKAYVRIRLLKKI
jgi:glycosyltransferase involved in cell wall biosynthesis